MGVPGIVWPAIKGAGASELVPDYFEIVKTQWLSPDELRAAQFRQLDALFRHAAEHVPYYRAILKETDWSPDKALDEKTWRSIPLLPRSVVQERGAELHATEFPKEHGRTFELSTSGSTGRKVTVVKTQIVDHFFQLIAMRENFWSKRDVSGRAAIIRYVHDARVAKNPRGNVTKNWGGSFGRLFATGPAAQLDIRHDIALQAEWLHTQNPDSLLTFPSNLRALVDAFKQRGWKLPRLKEMRTLSEALSAETRKAATEYFGVPVTDMYSAQEIGYIALQAPGSEHYLVQEEAVLVEVIGADGKPCAPGETGRVVITVLHNFAMPLIRYDIGDMAEVGQRAADGRGHGVLARIGGRVRNLVSTPDGKTYWPAVPLDVFQEVAPVRQFQLVQKSLELIEARMAVSRPLTAEEEARVTKLIHDGLNYPFAVTFTYLDSLPRDPNNGKFEDFKSEIARAA